MNKLLLTVFVVLLFASYFIGDVESFFRKGMISGRGNGPSGKPNQHFVDKPSRKDAHDAAQNAGKGNPPVHHQPHGPGQKPHFHPTNKDGSIKKDGSHFNHPKKG